MVESRRSTATEKPDDPETFFAKAVYARTQRNFHADEFAASLNYLGANRIDFKPLDLDDTNFSDQVSERYASAAQVSKLVGRQIAPVFAGEVQQIARQMKQSVPPQKMSLLGRIDEAFGDYTVALWRRLANPAQAQYDSAAARIARIALLATANRSLAAKVFEGHAAAQQDSTLLPSNVASMREWTSYRIGNALQNPKGRRDVFGDVLHLYALEARDHGIRSRDYDPDLLAAAYDDRVGDPIDCSGVSIISPVIGWTGDDLCKYLATLDAEAFGLDPGKGSRPSLPVLASTMRPVTLDVLRRHVQLREQDSGIFQTELNGESLIDPRSGYPLIFDFYRVFHRDGVAK
jgi:hypothetical protein